MRRFKFLLRPGWLLLAAVVVFFAYICFSVLAPWQLGKNTTTSHRNSLITNSVSATPVPLFNGLGSSGDVTKENEWTRVSVTGSYIPGDDVLVRLRTIKDAPAYEVITPFALGDGRVMMVNRGFVRPVQGTQPPPIAQAPSGNVTVIARLRTSEGTVAGKDPLNVNGVRQVYFIDSTQIGQAVGIDPINGYLQLDDAQPGGLGTIDLPQTDSGPYLSYGLQWLAFGIMAPLGLGYFARAELQERRKARAETAAAAGGPLPESIPDDKQGTEVSAEAPHGAPTSPVADDIVLPPRRFSRNKESVNVAPRSAAESKYADRYGTNR